MWKKNKFFLFSLSLQMMVFSVFALGGVVKAETKAADGFIIKADKVVGSGMLATIINQETSKNDSRPMLRVHYQSAVIYGMSLTKEVDSPNGPVSISLKAKGPVEVKEMTVDTTALSFQGACIKASELVPEIGMENVVMVAHYMDSKESNIEQLLQNIVSGKTESTEPSTLNILQELSKLSGNELNQEMTKISNGHLPLICESGTAANPVEKITDVVKNPLNPITKPLDPIGKIIVPVEKSIKKPLDPILKPLKPVTKPLDPILKPIKPITKPLEPVLKPLEPVIKTLDPVLESLKPIVNDSKEAAEKTLQSVCESLKEANGEITKELALKIIDEAIKNKQALTTICQDDQTETKWLKKWNDSLLNSLGLLDLFGVLEQEDPLQQLQKMREDVLKQKDGVTIFAP